MSRSIRGELGQQVLRAGDLLAEVQKQGLALARLGQDDQDRWIVTHPPRQRQLLKPFLVAALHQLVLQAPAPVVAQTLSFHYTTTQRHHAAAGGTWNRYTGREG